MLPPRQAKQPLVNDLEVDVAIIGAGYTGLAAAKRWRELAPADEIAIIDASEAGEGTPGRHSGFLLEIALANDARPAQMQRMTRCNELIAEAMSRIAGEVEGAAIDPGLQRSGVYRCAAGPEGARTLAQYRAFLQAAGLPFEELDRKAMQQNLGSSFYKQGIYSPHCYLVQPAALIRALTQKLPADIHLYENTPAIRLRKSGSRWLIETPSATLSSKKVILANNAFSKHLGVGKSRLVTIYTYAGLTRPIDNEPGDVLGSDPSWGILPTHRLGSTLRKMPDGRMMVRSFYSYEKETQTALVNKQLKKNLCERFPQLKAEQLDKVWGGAIGFTLGGGALWGEVKSGLYVSSGCNGGGVVKGTLFGTCLAELANGKQAPDIPALFGHANWMPPDPVRSVGFHLTSVVERFRGRAEI